MARKIKKSDCIGCRNNFYNGNNDLGVKECWSFNDAEIVSRKRVHYNLVPPWRMRPVKVPNCYHETGYAYVDPNREG